MMHTLQSGVYTGRIVDSSVYEPSTADQITYTVAVNVPGGVVTVEGVSPHPSKRASSYEAVGGSGGEVPDLYPFPKGSPVVMHLTVAGNRQIWEIGEGEIEAFGPCPTTGGDG